MLTAGKPVASANVSINDKIRAHDALFSALADVCRPDLEELWRNVEPILERNPMPGEDAPDEVFIECYEARAHLIGLVVHQWLARFSIDIPWLAARLIRAAGIDEIDKMADGAAFRTNDEGIAWHQARHFANLRMVMAAAWRGREIESTDPPSPDPANETQEEYLAKAKEHFNDVARAVVAAGYSLERSKPDLLRHARWYLLRRARGQSIAEVAAIAGCTPSAVEKATNRFAAHAE